MASFIDTAAASQDLSLQNVYDSHNSTNMHNIIPVDIVGVIHTWVIIGVTVIVAIVFIAVYLQLSVVLCYGYKLVSYQTVFLFNILLWASFRLTLNSFFFYHCCVFLSRVSLASKWFLVSFPEIPLFISLSLLVHYFMEHLFKVIRRNQDVSFLNPSYGRIKCCRVCGSVVWTLFIIIYIAASVAFSCINGDNNQELKIVRVVILESLVFIMGVILGVSMLVIYVTRAGKDIMDAKQVSKWQAVTIAILLLLLFCTRAIYNIIAIAVSNSQSKVASFFKFASDLGEFDMSQESDINFFCVLLLWEVVPISLIVLFFRVRISNKLVGSINCRCTRSSLTSGNNIISRHFFHGSRVGLSKQESNINSSFQKTSHVSIPSLPDQSSSTLPFSRAGYGSTASRTHFSVPNHKYNPPSFMPGTTPPQLFTGSPSVFSDSRADCSLGGATNFKSYYNDDDND